MSLEQVERMAHNMKKIGGGIVLLTGGEPFMHPHLPDMVKIFVSKGLNVRLQTAGTRFATEEKLLACYEAGARDINVSLDSLDFPTFDYINSVPGSAQNAIETMERISKIYRRESAILSFGTVLSRFNCREIPAILEFAKSIGWYVSLVPVHIAPLKVPRGFRSFDHLFRFDETLYSELESVADQIINMKKQGYPLFDSERFIRSSVSFLKGNGPTWRRNGVCDSPDLYFAIRPNGDFTTCCDYTLEEPPKVYDDDFVRKYNSGEIRARKDVRDIVESCEGCHYGSYPEVSLSVNDKRVFLERTWMTLKMGRGNLAHAPVQENFVAEVERVKSLFPQVYPVSIWQDEKIISVVKAWSDAEGRKELIKKDMEERKQQNRVRGSGEEPHFPLSTKGSA